MTVHLSYSPAALNHVKSFEQCRLKPYLDGGGVWTDGWGNTHRVDPQLTISQGKADKDLEANLQDTVDAINDHVTVDLSQCQFDALVGLIFNIGTTAFRNSTLLKKLNAGDLQGAHDQIGRWNQDNGKVVAGLSRRRSVEQAIFRGLA